MLTLGPPGVRRLLGTYWREEPPTLFASDEAARLAPFLERSLPAPEGGAVSHRPCHGWVAVG